MWWRCGIDPDTGKRREALARGKKAQETARPRATEARRIQAQDAKPDWHDAATLDAQEIRRLHPSYSRWRIAGLLCDKFGVSQNRCDKILRSNGIE
jgi:3-oxoacyl-[acyl-carrier-protein] synthase III